MVHSKRKQGFTLMEMLIVVAIIAVLAAIAIPAMGRSIHKAKESADLANVRAYYAYLQQDYMSTGTYRDFGLSWEYNVTDTITYNDGTTVKLQTGYVAVAVPTAEAQNTTSGYQVHYICSKGDLTYTFGEK